MPTEHMYEIPRELADAIKASGLHDTMDPTDFAEAMQCIGFIYAPNAQLIEASGELFGHFILTVQLDFAEAFSNAMHGTYKRARELFAKAGFDLDKHAPGADVRFTEANEHETAERIAKLRSAIATGAAKRVIAKRFSTEMLASGVVPEGRDGIRGFAVTDNGVRPIRASEVSALMDAITKAAKPTRDGKLN